MIKGPLKVTSRASHGVINTVQRKRQETPNTNTYTNPEESKSKPNSFYHMRLINFL